MKVGSSGPKAKASVGASRVGGRRNTTGSYGVGRSGGGDSVQLSSIAGDLASVGVGVDDVMPAAEPARLAMLRDAIERDEYPVDVKALAEAILADDVSVR